MVASVFASSLLYYGLRTSQLEYRTYYLKKLLKIRSGIILGISTCTILSSDHDSIIPYFYLS